MAANLVLLDVGGSNMRRHMRQNFKQSQNLVKCDVLCVKLPKVKI